MNIRPFSRVAQVVLAASIGLAATAGVASSAHADGLCAPKPKPTINLGGTGYFYEHEFAKVEISLSNASCTNVSVKVSTADLDAVSGQDYWGVSKTVTFSPGQTIKTVNVYGVNDDVQEGAKAFSVSLSNASGGTNSWGKIIVVVDGVEPQ